jgi:hypothetical protein
LLGTFWFAALGILSALGCRSSVDDRASVSADAPAPAEPAPDPEPPAPSSVAPLYALVASAEYERLAPPVDGVPAPLRDQDFTTAEVRVSAADMLDAIAQRLADERESGSPPADLIPPEDRPRARGIPFPGNPSDALLAETPEGARFLPLDRRGPGHRASCWVRAANRGRASR